MYMYLYIYIYIYMVVVHLFFYPTSIKNNTTAKFPNGLLARASNLFPRQCCEGLPEFRKEATLHGHYIVTIFVLLSSDICKVGVALNFDLQDCRKESDPVFEDFL